MDEPHNHAETLPRDPFIQEENQAFGEEMDQRWLARLRQALDEILKRDPFTQDQLQAIDDKFQYLKVIPNARALSYKS